ncbi:uncharacterized protein LOC126721344 [Quercus robur]|uniref:uncharacterized protein LOC126721344 n=1 Tax=Quercus robur TaxID=38942 RepID=UPI002161F30F|nr:uncharacterized protein LOC126721344 [Quercus robur]
MAASPVNQTSLHHFRSKSFPTRAHPLISEFNEQLSRVRGSETTSSSSTSLSQKLIGLQDLHDSVENLLLLPCTQALAQEQHQKWFNELLDGSLRLLDVCGIARDALLQTKECARELQSTLRRRHGNKMELAREVEKYLASRKVVKKAMQKALKGMQTKLNCKKNEDLAMVSLLKELEAVTFLVFESLLTFIAGPKLQSKSNGWFVVSKLVHQKKVVCEDEETDANEFDKADAALQSLNSHKTSKSDYSILVQNVQNWMGKLESSIEDVEEVLECLSRHLVKTQVSFLNILNH